MARVDRLHIGIFGRINAGKSTLMNVLTQQETSIVDPTPGTTTDVKSAVMQVHALGPVRVSDTAGLDEAEVLGEKKRAKTLAALEQVDVAVLVVDPVQVLRAGELQVEERVAEACRRLGKRLVLVCNVRGQHEAQLAALGATLHEAVEHCKTVLVDRASVPQLVLDLHQPGAMRAVVDGLVQARPDAPAEVPLLPFVDRRGPVLLHIPLDEESPKQRLLRPQEMAMEFLLRLHAPVALARANLRLARSENEVVERRERERFMRFYDALAGSGEVQLVLTDSQAIDVMHRWLPETVPLTTFSVMMIHQTSGGNLRLFAEGARALDGLRGGDRVLVVEACNHDRMAEDIGTVQIPRKLQARVPGVVVDHQFGREFPDVNVLQGYQLAIHCGGCMISKQQAAARVRRLAEAGIPVTNYGMVLAWFQGAEVLERVLRPWLR